jgi:type VI secretion system protein ImpG
MRDDLLPYYESELTFIRQMAAEFAAKYPKVAGRLQLQSQPCADPHVERLIDAFALLAARVRRKVDDEFPEITESLLEVLYPHYLRPIPSMSIAQVEVDPEQGKLTTGYPVDKGATLYSKPVGGIPCQFRTCYPVTLWPLEVISASAVSPSGFSIGPAVSDAAAVVRIELRCLGGARFAELQVDALRFFLGGDSQTAHTLYELIGNNAFRLVIRNPMKGSRAAPTALPKTCLRQVGFGRQEGLLPYSDRSFLGYRLLQEYFSFPEKFLFFEISGLDGVPRIGFDDRFEILILLNEFQRKERLAQLEQTVNADTFRLGCTPIINLFERCAEPIRISHAVSEYRVIPDVHNELATEVYSVDQVTSATPYSQEPQEYQPFYSLRHTYNRDPGQTFWHSSRRPSHRKGDAGTEVYLALVDLGFKPSLPPVETLTVHVTCTNRDLPAKLPFTGQFGELEMESGPLLRIRCLRKPTETVRPPLGTGPAQENSTRGSLQWRLISHLGLNHLSIIDAGLNALQEILRLYDFSERPEVQKQIVGITRISSTPQIARVPSEHGVVFCQGIRVSAEFDEEQYVGSGVFLLASVLERFFGLYGPINSFSELRVTTQQRKGVLRQWAPRAGEQVLL